MYKAFENHIANLSLKEKMVMAYITAQRHDNSENMAEMFVQGEFCNEEVIVLMRLIISLIGPRQARSYSSDYDVIIEEIDDDYIVESKRRQAPVAGVYSFPGGDEELIRFVFTVVGLFISLIWILYRVTCWFMWVTKLGFSLAYPDDFVLS